MKKGIKVALWGCGIIVGIKVLLVGLFFLIVFVDLYKISFNENTNHWRAFSNHIEGTWNIDWSELVNADLGRGYREYVRERIDYHGNFRIVFNSNGEGYYELDGQHKEFNYSLDDYYDHHVIWIKSKQQRFYTPDTIQTANYPHFDTIRALPVTGVQTDSTGFRSDRLMNVVLWKTPETSSFPLAWETELETMALFFYKGNIWGNKVQVINNSWDNDHGYIAYSNGLINGYRFYMVRE